MPDIIDIRPSGKTGKNAPTEKEEAAKNTTQPQQKRTLGLPEIVDVATRLGRILAMESHFLDNMDFKSVAELQEEKNKLISALEIQKKILKLDPSIKQSFPADEIKEFESVSSMFDAILNENHRQLLRVKSVNRRVVDIIVKAATNPNSPTAYGKNGTVVAQPLSDLPLALSQNV